MAEILHMPAPPKRAGRRRTHPVPNMRIAGVLEFHGAHPTPEDELADYQACVKQAARGLLMAVEAIRTLDRKYHKD